MLTGVLGVAGRPRFSAGLLGLDPKWGVAGLTAIRRHRRVGGVCALAPRALPARWASSRFRAVNWSSSGWPASLPRPSAGVRESLGCIDLAPIPLALLAVPANAITYLAITAWWDIPEAAVLTTRIRRMLGGNFHIA